MKKLLPVIVILAGLGVGAGAGFVLRPTPETRTPVNNEESAHENSSADEHGDAEIGEVDYVKLNNQFVVPVVRNGRVAALVVMSLSLEVGAGGREIVYTREPRIRDALLTVLFEHANSGGFDGAFTASRKMNTLRRSLTEATRSVLETDLVANVLIIDIVRQDLG